MTKRRKIDLMLRLITRDVEQNIGVFPKFVEARLEPVKICFQILHAVQHSPIRTKTMRIHRIMKSDETRDIYCTRIWDVLVGRVEVDDGYGRCRAVKSWYLPEQYVDLPLPGAPQTISPKGPAWFARGAVRWCTQSQSGCDGRGNRAMGRTVTEPTFCKLDSLLSKHSSLYNTSVLPES